MSQGILRTSVVLLFAWGVVAGLHGDTNASDSVEGKAEPAHAPNTWQRLYAKAERSDNPLKTYIKEKINPNVGFYFGASTMVGTWTTHAGTIHVLGLLHAIQRGPDASGNMPGDAHNFLAFYDANEEMRLFWEVDDDIRAFYLDGSKLMYAKKPPSDSQIPRKKWPREIVVDFAAPTESSKVTFQGKEYPLPKW